MLGVNRSAHGLRNTVNITMDIHDDETPRQALERQARERIAELEKYVQLPQLEIPLVRFYLVDEDGNITGPIKSENGVRSHIKDFCSPLNHIREANAEIRNSNKRVAWEIRYYKRLLLGMNTKQASSGLKEEDFLRNFKPAL